MSWDFLGKLTRPLGNFEEKVLDKTPGGTPMWRLRQKIGEGFHDESGLSNSQAIGLGALIGTGAAAAGGAFGGAAGGAGIGGGSYSVAEGMPALGNGVEGGAMDMYGSQASPAGGSVFNYSSPAAASNYRMPQMQQQKHGPVQMYDTMYDDGTSRQNDTIQALIRALKNA